MTHRRHKTSGTRRTTVQEAGSLIRSDDRRPTGNFALHQRTERLLTSLCLGRNGAADIYKAPARVVVVECSVERIRELVDDRLWCALRRKQGVPRHKRGVGLMSGVRIN